MENHQKSQNSIPNPLNTSENFKEGINEFFSKEKHEIEIPVFFGPISDTNSEQNPLHVEELNPSEVMTEQNGKKNEENGVEKKFIITPRGDKSGTEYKPEIHVKTKNVVFL